MTKRKNQQQISASTLSTLQQLMPVGWETFQSRVKNDDTHGGLSQTTISALNPLVLIGDSNVQLSDLPMGEAGIYSIAVKIGNRNWQRVYVGESKCIKTRLVDHLQNALLWHLKRGPALYEYLNTVLLTHNTMRFKVLETGLHEKSDRLKREKYFIQDTKWNLFNISSNPDADRDLCSRMIRQLKKDYGA